MSTKVDDTKISRKIKMEIDEDCYSSVIMAQSRMSRVLVWQCWKSDAETDER